MPFVHLSLFASGCAGPLNSMPRPTGYATTEGYEQALDSWLGAPGDDLAARWGTPDKTLDLPSGGRIWTYHSIYQHTTPIASQTTYNETTGTYQTEYSGGDIVTEYCYTDFELNDAGTITRWRYEGNDCVAVPEPKPMECLLRGGSLRVARLGTLTGETDSPEDDLAAVELTDAAIWRVSNIGGSPPPSLHPGVRVGVCLKSGLGSYLFAFPARSIVVAERVN